MWAPRGFGYLEIRAIFVAASPTLYYRFEPKFYVNFQHAKTGGIRGFRHLVVLKL